jgi:hypothetical protein
MRKRARSGQHINPVRNCIFAFRAHLAHDLLHGSRRERCRQTSRALDLLKGCPSRAAKLGRDVLNGA